MKKLKIRSFGLMVALEETLTLDPEKMLVIQPLGIMNIHNKQSEQM